MAGQIVELAANFSKGRGKCWGRLYLDLSAAFDSILREFLIADSTCDVQLMQSALKALNISDEVCEQIISEAITERNLVRRTGASAQLGDLVGDMHTATWLVCSNEMPDDDGFMDETRQSTKVPVGRHCLQPDVRTGVAQSTNSWRKARNLERDHVPPGTATLEAKARIEEHTRQEARNWITTKVADVTFVDDACFSFEADNPVFLVSTASALLRRVAIGAMETLLDDLRWVREASTTLRRMPDPFHQPEPWMILLENEEEWSKALRQLDAKCSRPKKPEGARYMSDDQLMANPQAFACMLCSGDKRRFCNSAGARVSHEHRSHGYHNPFRRAIVDDSCPALEQKRWITSLTPF